MFLALVHTIWFVRRSNTFEHQVAYEGYCIEHRDVGIDIDIHITLKSAKLGLKQVEVFRIDYN